MSAPAGPPISEMTSPVRCGYCGGVYDLGTVTVTARYTDCSVWRAPCCKREVDDRPPGWGGPVRAYERITSGEARIREIAPGVFASFEGYR